MTASFRSASTAGSGFRGTLSGITRAAGTGLTSAMRGLVGVMGGPWGLALTGVAVGLGLLADRQQKAAERAAAHEQRISDLTEALLASNGAIDANVRAQAAKFLMDTKTADGGQRLVDVMKNAGVSLSELTDAYLGQGLTLMTFRVGCRQSPTRTTTCGRPTSSATPGRATTSWVARRRTPPTP